jgi:hypothetical protein
MTILVNYIILNKKGKHFLLALKGSKRSENQESTKRRAAAINNSQGVPGSRYQADWVDRLGDKIEITHIK